MRFLLISQGKVLWFLNMPNETLAPVGSKMRAWKFPVLQIRARLGLARRARYLTGQEI